MIQPNSGQAFMVQSRYEHLSPSPQDSGKIPQPPLESPRPTGTIIPLKPQVELKLPAMDLRQAMEARRTIRKYTDQPLSLDEISYLLWVSQGVKHVSARPSTARNVPSAGARHAFETLVLVNRVDGLAPGLYRYMAIDHALVDLRADHEITALVKEACLGQNQVEGCAATFIWVAVVERMFWRYVERGYRYLHLDAGHVCQNLALGAEQIGSGICPIAAFNDEHLNRALNLDGEDQFVIYLATVGKKLES
jgi:SagB-type dehydrogenase family enzyme